MATAAAAPTDTATLGGGGGDYHEQAEAAPTDTATLGSGDDHEQALVFAVQAFLLHPAMGIACLKTLSQLECVSKELLSAVRVGTAALLVGSDAARPSADVHWSVPMVERMQQAVLLATGWGAQLGWEPDKPLSFWRAIEVEKSDSGVPLVVAINMACMNLHGSLAGLSSLPAVRSVVLEHNRLRGELPIDLLRKKALGCNVLLGDNKGFRFPPEVHMLGTELSTLDLSSMSLCGAIPASLGALTGLRYLNLERNKLSGPLPLSVLRLHARARCRLVLGGNSGLSLPRGLHEVVGDVARLDLNLPGSALVSVIPDDISRCTTLTVLNLANNLICGRIPPQLGLCRMLEELALGSNALTGPIPHQLGNCLLLRRFEAYNNKLSGSFPTEVLTGCTHLASLNCSDNKIRGPIPSSIGGCAALEKLCFGSNLLTGNIPSSIGQCTNLQDLQLYNNKLVSIVPPAVSLLTALTNVNLSDNRLSGAIPSGIALCSALRTLCLGSNRLCGTVPAGVQAGSGSLTNLELYNNPALVLVAAVADDAGPAKAKAEYADGRGGLRRRLPLGAVELC